MPNVLLRVNYSGIIEKRSSRRRIFPFERLYKSLTIASAVVIVVAVSISFKCHREWRRCEERCEVLAAQNLKLAMLYGEITNRLDELQFVSDLIVPAAEPPSLLYAMPDYGSPLNCANRCTPQHLLVSL